MGEDQGYTSIKLAAALRYLFRVAHNSSRVRCADVVSRYQLHTIFCKLQITQKDYPLLGTLDLFLFQLTKKIQHEEHFTLCFSGAFVN